MLSRTRPQQADFGEILERELVEGVHVEHFSFMEGEDGHQSILGGLITADEHVHVEELSDPPRPRKH